MKLTYHSCHIKCIVNYAFYMTCAKYNVNLLECISIAYAVQKYYVFRKDVCFSFLLIDFGMRSEVSNN